MTGHHDQGWHSRSNQALACPWSFLHPKAHISTRSRALTDQDSCNYSVVMDSEFTALEDDIRKASQLYKRLREENLELRLKLSEMEIERRSLGEKIESARLRLEGLLKQIPE